MLKTAHLLTRHVHTPEAQTTNQKISSNVYCVPRMYYPQQ